ncbi:MAG: MFS transporter [Chloroflexi bacterium]|nr:MFS transporter [Chloroflexota bacterium]MDA1226648.1 MFS transporter [Chloroflexota bacterium]
MSLSIDATGNAYKWLGLVAASYGLFLGALDITVNVALPDITRDLGTDLRTIQWIIVFYVGSTAGMQLSLGSAADKYGLKRFYIIGLGIYTMAVLLIGLAPNLSMVFGLRVLQAVGNGLILASVPALVTSIFPREERGRGLGLMAGIATLGLITGASAGGVLVDAFGWRAIFLARVPLALIAIVLAFIVLREPRQASISNAFDFRGGVALFVGLGSLILFLTLGGRTGWLTPQVLGLALLSLVGLSTFAYFERHTESPVLDLSLLRHRVLAPAMIASFLMFLATFVNWFILPFYVSDTLGADAKTLGILLMLMTAMGAVTAPVGGWLSDRMPPAYIITVALLVSSLSTLWFTQLNSNSSVADVALRMAATGVGIGLFQASSATLIMGTVSADRLGTGGAILALSRGLGTVSSVAIMSAVFAGRLAFHTSSVGQEAEAFVLAFSDTYLIAAILAAVAALVSITYWPRWVRDKP